MLRHWLVRDLGGLFRGCFSCLFGMLVCGVFALKGVCICGAPSLSLLHPSSAILFEIMLASLKASVGQC